MRRRLVIILLVMMFVLSGCSAAANQLPMEAPSVGEGAAPAAMPEMDRQEEYSASDSYTSGSIANQAPTTSDRIVVRNASLNIVVEDPGNAMSKISRMSETMGGFVVTSNLYKTYTENGVEVPEATITVRVPAEKLAAALDEIKALVKDPDQDILSESVSGQDVTAEYTDLNSRLRNLKETEAQLREIMASAVRTEDVLAVNQELTRVREQIEVLEGQIKYYDEAAALSSIAVQLKAEASVQPVEIGGWRPVGVARDALQALIDAMQFLASAAIWLVIFALPIALIIYFPLRFLWSLLRRGRNNKKTQLPTPPAAPPAENA
jgi:hypothetical protein